MTTQKILRRDKETSTERRAVRTRKALMSAGLTLFAQRSIEGVSIDDIAAAADVTKASFYNHFAAKDELANEVIATIRDQMYLMIRQANTGINDAASQIVRGYCTIFRHAVDHPEQAMAFARLTPGISMTATPLNHYIETILQNGIATAKFRDIDVLDGKILIIGIVTMSMTRIIEADEISLPVLHARAVVLGAAMLRSLGVTAARAAKTAQRAADDLLIHTTSNS